MTVIPNFILKRMYKDASLRRLDGGVGFDIVNNLGPGQISKLNSVTMNGKVYPPTHVKLLIGADTVAGDSISEENPATFFLNQVITCLIQDSEMADGPYQVTLDLVSREAGKVTLTVKDTLKSA
jgi:hypothetical protein